MNRSASVFALSCLVLYAGAVASAAPAASAREILEATGVAGGLVVHVGCGDGKLTAALRANESYLVHGLDADAANVAAARKHIRSLGVYGKVSVMKLTGARLPYAENLVNLLVSEDLGAVGMDEVMRVLVPNGVAYIKREGSPGLRSPPKPQRRRGEGGWVKTVKPRPADIDEWTHYLHGPDNNAVADDTVVGPPRRVQWMQAPRSDRHHDTIANFRAVVSAGGRIFSIEDEGPIELPYWPGEWVLKARDAFNGKLLWKRPIREWEPVSRPHRTGPVQQPRRLVAVGDRVYVTLGLAAPVTALDAATGKTVRTYKGTERTQEIVVSDGVLFLVVGDPTYPTGLSYLQQRSKLYGHNLKTDPAVVEGPVCSVVAIDAGSGKKLWAKSPSTGSGQGAETKGYKAMSLAVRGDRAVFQNARSLVCLDRASGRELWRAPRATAIKNPGTPPAVVIGEKAVYSADGKSLIAFSPANGKELWKTGSSEGHPVSGPNVFLIRNKVWLDHRGGFNPLTGAMEQPVGKPRKDTMSHHRCYRDKATSKYLLIGENGVEFLPLGSQADISHNFVRGTCQYGIVPCNGLLYVTPDNCECNRSVKLNNYLALAPSSAPPSPRLRRATEGKPAVGRLVKGPAYGKVEKMGTGTSASGFAPPSPRLRRATPDESLRSQTPFSDWPTFRHDPLRSGVTTTEVPAEVRRAWQVELGGKLSQPVVAGAAGGRLFVAQIDEHTVHALNAQDGRRLWSFVADGRVDSPPTIYRGLVLFGSADGWVYCLRAADGELAWRFHAAPQQRFIGAWEQIESAWPVHGSVLVVNDTAYFTAGRSTFLDGGIYLYGLDPLTGRKRHEYLFHGPWDEQGRHQVVRKDGKKDLEGGLSDILSSDGKLLYLRNNAFDLTCRPVRSGVRLHLFASAGFLDDSWNHRTKWMVGTILTQGGTPQYYPFKGNMNKPEGEILTFDGKNVFGLLAYPTGRHSVFDPRKSGYVLFAGAIGERPRGAEQAGRAPAAGGKKVDRKGRKGRKGASGASKERFGYTGKWLVRVQVAARAMVKTGGSLFIAGTPNVYDPKDPPGAIRGRKGGVLWAISPADGKKRAACSLDSPPVFDGMIAAGRRLYIATRDGRIVCFEE